MANRIEAHGYDNQRAWRVQILVDGVEKHNLTAEQAAALYASLGAALGDPCPACGARHHQSQECSENL